MREQLTNVQIQQLKRTLDEEIQGRHTRDQEVELRLQGSEQQGIEFEARCDNIGERQKDVDEQLL